MKPRWSLIGLAVISIGLVTVTSAVVAHGAAWATSITMDSGQLNEFPSLAEVNGAPGIAYED